MDLKMKGKVAVITGASSGIGKAIALAFAKEGCKVAINGRTQSTLDAVKKEFNDQGYELFTSTFDVADYESIEKFADDVADHYGKIDIWVNNAGQFRSSSILEQSMEEWREIMAINVDSCFWGTKAAAKHMKETGGGVIINESSYASILPACYRSSYATSKYAISGFTRCSAGELAPFGIRVNAVAPGTINTQMQATSGRTAADIEKLSKRFALRRMGEPEEVANVCLFLASDMSSYVTGIVIEISGGKLTLQNCDLAWEQRR